MQTSPMSSREHSEPQSVPAHQHFACDILPCPSDRQHEQCAGASSTTRGNSDDVQVSERPHAVERSRSALPKPERPLQSTSTRSCTVQTSTELTSDDIPTRDSDHSAHTRDPLKSEDFEADESQRVKVSDRGAGDASRLLPEKPTFSSAQPLPSRRPHKKRFRRSRTSQEITEEPRLNSIASQSEQEGDSQDAAEENVSLSETVPRPVSASSADVAQFSRVSVDTLTDVSDVDVSWSFAKSPSKHWQSQERPILSKTAAREPQPTRDVVVCSNSVELRSSQHWQAHSTTATTTAVSATVTEVSPIFTPIARNT